MPRPNYAEVAGLRKKRRQPAAGAELQERNTNRVRGRRPLVFNATAEACGPSLMRTERALPIHQPPGSTWSSCTRPGVGGAGHPDDAGHCITRALPGSGITLLPG